MEQYITQQFLFVNAI